jgi:hypothetical protein
MERDTPWNGRGITREHAFGLLRILFGCIWLLNTWFQANSAYIITCS